MFEKYSEYKDSGVEWLGGVPQNWNIKKLKFVSKINPSNPTLPYDRKSAEKVVFLPMERISETGKIDQRILKGVFELSSGFTYFEKNDVLVAKITPCFENGKGALLNDLITEFGFGSTEFHTIRATKEITKEFIFYMTKSSTFMTFGEMSMIGSAGQKRVPSDFIKDFRIAVPPLAEQTAIANFLDRKTAQIDQAISIKEKQIELLKERRQILIHNAVTRGLDSEVKMKDSGVSWIGEIPEHWEVLANRVLFTERNQPGREGLPLLSVSIHTAISSEELDEESNIRGKIKIEDKSNYKLVEVNDIVFNMMRAWQGAIGAVRVKGMVSPAYVVAKPNKKLDANYAEYQYRTSIYIQEMNRVSKGITDFRKRLYWHEFKQLTTILPPFEEQKEIASYIENISEKIATAVSLKQKEIEKLKEYKSTLINSAVTGKIKVS